MKEKEEAPKKKKRSIFSLDPHMSVDVNIKDSFKSFSNILKSFHSSAAVPITDLGSALQSWGLTNKSREEIEAFRKRRQWCGMASAILLCFMFLLAGWNWYHSTFGLLSGAQYAIGGFALLALTSVCFWQADILSGDKFRPFYQYAACFKWLVGMFVLTALSTYEGNAIAALPGFSETAVDMPDFVIKKTEDLSAIFVGSIIGEAWLPHAGVSLSALNALGMDSVLIPVLAAVNTGAMLFVSVYATYIHTFGAIHIAHTGRWEDNQIFSSLWSPVRSVVALGLCSPVANGVSLMQHLILVAVAMSINFADNISMTFVNYLEISGAKGFALSAPAIHQANNDFAPVFSAVATAAAVQNAYENMGGSEENPNQIVGERIQFREEENTPTLLREGKGVTEHTLRVTFGGPKEYLKSMPYIVVTAKEKWMKDVYKNAIQGLYTNLDNFAREYFAKKIEDRRKNETQLKSSLKQWRQQFDSEINSQLQSRSKQNEQAQHALELVSRMKAYTDRWGWVTIGIYPFIVAKVQGDWQSAFSVRVAANVGMSIANMKSLLVLSESETQVIDKFFAEVAKNEKEESIFAKTTSFMSTPVPSGEGILTPIMRVFMENFGLTPEQLAKEFQESNAVAVMHSKGTQCMTAAGAAMTFFGSFMNEVEKKGLQGAINELGNLQGVDDIPNDIGGSLKIWAPVVMVALSVILMFGFSCAYVIPAIPMVFWGRALSSWAVLLVQTMMGAPFWAAAHVLPEGQGLAGQHAKQGYLMLLDVFIRPALLTCGAIMSMLLMEAWTKVLSKILFMWASLTIDATNYNYIGFFFTTGVCLFVMYTTIRWLFIQAIGEFPQQVIRWCGGQVHDTSMQDANQSAQAITGKMQEAMYLMRSPRSGGMPGALGQTGTGTTGGRTSKEGS